MVKILSDKKGRGDKRGRDDMEEVGLRKIMKYRENRE